MRAKEASGLMAFWADIEANYLAAENAAGDRGE